MFCFLSCRGRRRTWSWLLDLDLSSSPSVSCVAMPSSSASLRCPPSVSARVFRAVQRVDVEALAQCGGGGKDATELDPSSSELRPVLASLVRMSLIASLDKSRTCSADRTAVLQVLSRIELVNNLVALLSIDFHALENDVRKEQKARAAAAGAAEGGAGSALVSSLAMGPALEFERSDATRKLRLVLAELIGIMGQVRSLPLLSLTSHTTSIFHVCRSRFLLPRLQTMPAKEEGAPPPSL